MNLYDIIGTPDTIAAKSDFEALEFYHTLMDELGVEDWKARLVPDRELDTREVYDEDCVVNEHSSIVTFRQLADVEAADWGGTPYVFSTID